MRRTVIVVAVCIITTQGCATWKPSQTAPSWEPIATPELEQKPEVEIDRVELSEDDDNVPRTPDSADIQEHEVVPPVRINLVR